MGSLTSYLQQKFAERCPPGWTSNHEVYLLSKSLQELLGYAPRADILLKRDDESRKIWIEFEVSRADPVANHAKFATSHLFQPLTSTDIFISMISNHVTRGRCNLAANTVALMRHLGINAFQTTLFPSISGESIKRLNHLSQDQLQQESLNVESEIERALSVSEVLVEDTEHRIYFTGNMLEVLLNLRRWNESISLTETRTLWGKRTITYFVYDPRSKKFAPSKFCAYLAVPFPQKRNVISATKVPLMGMTVDLYARLDNTEPRFDGRRARLHLIKHLAMASGDGEQFPEVIRSFEKWLNRQKDTINVHPSGPVFLVPPKWSL